MRALLPPDVPREQAVFNIQRTALLIDCLHRGDLIITKIRDGGRAAPAGASDHLPPLKTHVPGGHQRRRPRRLPLSGAGPTILAICSGATGGDIFTQTREERQENGVANAMRRAVDSLSANTTSGRGQVLRLLAVLPGLPRRLGRPAHVRRDGDVRDARRGPLARRGGGARVRRDGVRHALRGPLARRRARPALATLLRVLGWRQACILGGWHPQRARRVFYKINPILRRSLPRASRVQLASSEPWDRVGHQAVRCLWRLAVDDFRQPEPRPSRVVRPRTPRR